MWGYYRRLLWTASIGRSWSLAGSVVGVISVVASVASFIAWRVADSIVSQITSLITAIIFVLLFLGRLVAAPYWIHQEDEATRKAERSEEERKRAELEVKRQAEHSEEEKKRAELEAERGRLVAILDNRENDRRKRDDQKKCLAELAADGEQLKAAKVHNREQLNEWMERYREWRGRVESEVGRSFSAAEAKRLSAIRGEIDRLTPTADGNHQDAIAHISGITKEMHEMSRSLLAKD
jgi:flagellar motility protein MotE (MotC chaperone)